MPLSDHEQRLLDQIERELYAEDPKFASSVRRTDPRVHYKRRVVKAAIGVVLGVCVVVAGVIVKTMPLSAVISAAGSVLLVLCVIWAGSSWRRMTGGAPEPGRSKRRRGSAPGVRPKSGLMERFEQRWRRRHGEED